MACGQVYTVEKVLDELLVKLCLSFLAFIWLLSSKVAGVKKFIKILHNYRKYKLILKLV